MTAAISPDAKLVAATMTETPPMPAGEAAAPAKPIHHLLFWELATGKLLREIPLRSPYSHFLFVDNHRVLVKYPTEDGLAMKLIDCHSDYTDYLCPPQYVELYPCESLGDKVLLQVSRTFLFVDASTKKQTFFRNRPPEPNDLLAERAWVGPDNKHIFAIRGGAAEIWDVERRAFQKAWQLTTEGKNRDLVAPVGPWIGRVVDPKTVEVINLQEGRVVTRFKDMPVDNFIRASICGISADGKRVILPTPEWRMLILDFPDGLPTGEIAVSPLYEKEFAKIPVEERTRR